MILYISPLKAGHLRLGQRHGHCVFSYQDLLGAGESFAEVPHPLAFRLPKANESEMLTWSELSTKSESSTELALVGEPADCVERPWHDRLVLLRCALHHLCAWHQWRSRSE